MYSKNHGFTLVELAIVIVIIGLLVGGVLQGQELINQAKIRSQIKQLEEFDTASLTFRSKYNSIPGDIMQARKTMFGISVVGGGGNGDGILQDQSGNIPNIYSWQEGYLYFIVLSDTKLIKDNVEYSGGNYNVGVALPYAKIGNGGVAAVGLLDGIYYYLGPTVKDSTSGSGSYTAMSTTPSLIPQDAYGIDTKIDDGIPSSGLVRAIVVTNSVATTFANDTVTSSCLGVSNQVYNITSSSPLCRIVVKSKIN